MTSIRIGMSEADLQQHSEGHRSKEKWQIRFLEKLGSSLREQQRSGQHCDVIVKVNGVTFPCHKAVLCAVSPYFTAMFSHDMKESRDSIVVLHETKADLFKLLLDNIYEGKDIVTEENVHEILEVASLMQIEMLMQRIEEYFKGILTTDNFIDIWYVAKKYSCKNLERMIWKFMTQNFCSLVTTEEFFMLPFETFFELLKSDDLVARSEEMICDATLKWLTTDVNNRKVHAPELMSALRLPLCSANYILNRFQQQDHMNIFPDIGTVWQEALKYRMCLAHKQNYTSSQTTQRNASRLDDVMVVIGGTDTSEYSGSGMRCYSFHRKEWYTLPPVPKTIGPHYALCTYGDDIYVSGGQYFREAFCTFMSATCTWTTLSKMINGRFQHAMVASGDSIYVIGGEGSSAVGDIDEYQVNTGLWETSGQLLDNISYTCAAVVGSKILIFGCNNTNNKSSDCTQIYDTFSKQVTRVNNMNMPGIGAHVVTCDSLIYVITADGRVSKLTDESTIEHTGTIPHFHPKRFSITQYRGMFYIVTCSKNSKEAQDETKVIVVDPAGLGVLGTADIPPEGAQAWLSNGSRLACARITIGKHHLNETKRVP